MTILIHYIYVITFDNVAKIVMCFLVGGDMLRFLPCHDNHGG